jgi:hypothetical protein
MLLSPRTSVLRRLRAALVLVGAFCAVGCAQRAAAPSPAPVGANAPLDVRYIQVATVEGHRAVLVRLTQVPSMVRASSSRNPAEILVHAWGPMGDFDMPERNFPQPDAYLPEIRVSRKGGELRIALQLAGDVPPQYTVHEMADWIMVRLIGGRQG